MLPRGALLAKDHLPAVFIFGCAADASYDICVGLVVWLFGRLFGLGAALLFGFWGGVVFEELGVLAFSGPSGPSGFS
jgi:hypothetical protein